MNFLWSIIKKNLNEPGTKGGFLAYAFIILVIISFLINYLGFNVTIRIKFIIILVIEFLWIICWLFYSKIIIYPSKKIRIGFTIKTEKESKEHYKEIKKQFIRNIESHNLFSVIQVIRFPSDVIFQEKEKAEKFAYKKHICVLVWGDTSEGTRRKDEISKFNVNFSYLYFPFEGKSKFLTDIQEFIGKRDWIISGSNSFDSIPVVSENVTEIVLYVLGKCLASSRSLDLSLKAIKIFEQLKDRLDKNSSTFFPRIEQLKQKTNIYLDNIYTDLSIYYLDKAGYYEDLDKKKELMKSAKNYAEKAVKINENNFRMCQNLALFEYIERNIPEAKKYTQKVLKITPRSPLPHFNVAFFALREERYEDALDEYKKIRINEEVNILEIIEFLEKELEKHPDNLGFLFASGWLNLKYADEEMGAEQLNNFLDQLDQADKNTKYKYSVLIREAGDLIKKG